jgi:uroporphyrinogen III methyltransferase/synthase
VGELRRYQWLVFTSVNGVKPFIERVRKKGLDARALAGLRICCIGPRTAEALKTHGLSADMVPSEYQAEGLIEAMKAAGMKGQRVLIPRAEVAREILPEQLRAMGAEVNVVTAYRTVRPEGETERMKTLLRERGLHVLTFASSSTVKNFAALFGGREELRRATAGAVVACIGPITARTAEAEGLSVTITAAENTIPSLVEAIIRYYAACAEGVPVRC